MTQLTEAHNLQFIQPKADTLDPEEVLKRERKILSGVIDDARLQEEAHEVLAKIALRDSKRKRNEPPVSSNCDAEYSDEMVVALQEILKKSYQRTQSSGLKQKISESPDLFRKMIDALDCGAFDTRELFSAIRHKTFNNNIILNILTLLQKKWISFRDLAENMEDDKFGEVCFQLICKGDDVFNAFVIDFLINNAQYGSTLTQVCVSSVINPPGVCLNNIRASRLSTSDLIASLLRGKPVEALEETHSNVVDIFKDEHFQSRSQKLQQFLSQTSSDKIISSLSTTCSICNVNPTYLMVIWSVLLRRDDCLSSKFSFVSELLKDAITRQSHHNFVLSIVLTRCLDLVGCRPYSESYQLFFGNSSSHITSSKLVEFILDEFTTLVPFEVGMFLRHHIQLPLRGGAKFKEKLDQYMMLAKTRMKDFSLLEIDKNIVHDVEKAITSFKKKGSVPSSIIEASIFKKQYYINHFLPFLLKSKCVEDEEGRQQLVDALKAANKIPKSVVCRPELEVEEITPAASLESVILSLPSKGYEAKDAIYSQCCSGCDKATLMLLIQTVCLRCQNVDPLDFLKDFAVVHHLRDMFIDCVQELIADSFESCDDDNVVFSKLLELFDTENCTSILKSAILRNQLIYKSIPVTLELDYLHVIVLGKLTENPNVLIPEAVWKQLSVEKLCETLTWWPYDLQQLSEFQCLVSKIMDNIISNQPSNAVCVSLFKSCLTRNILPLVSTSFITLLPLTTFTRLWIYEALAKVLLPLYQRNAEKPVSRIQEIFRNFFNLVNVIKPSLLYKCGDVRSVDHLLSVLDSYKVYITTEKYLLSYPITLTAVRSVQDPGLFNTLCEKSPTFLVSCVCYISELEKVRGAECLRSVRVFECLRSSEVVTSVMSFLKKLDKRGVSSNDYPDEKYCPHIGVSWFVLFGERHVSEFSVVSFKSTIMEGYLTAMFYTYCNYWLSGTLQEKHLASLGELAVQCPHYHETYTKPLLERGAPLNGILNQHFNGYKTNKVLCLVYLGGVAHCYTMRHDMPVHSDSILALSKKSYQQAQRLVYDNVSTMKSMQGFMFSVTRGGDTCSAARQFIDCLTRGWTLAGS